MQFPEIPKHYPITDKVSAYYTEKYNNMVWKEDLSKIIIYKRSVESSIGHGIGSKKAAAFTCVPEIITNEKIIDYQMNCKNRIYDATVLIAPV